MECLLYFATEQRYNPARVFWLISHARKMIMVFRILTVCILLFAVAISGCAKSHPGNYAQPEVEAQVKKSLELIEIQLTPDPAGGYSGTGKNAQGETYKLKISQNEALKRLSWKADGDRGDLREGNFQFE